MSTQDTLDGSRQILVAVYKEDLKRKALLDPDLADEALAELGYARVGVQAAEFFRTTCQQIEAVKEDIQLLQGIVGRCTTHDMPEKEKAPSGQGGSQLEFDFELDG